MTQISFQANFTNYYDNPGWLKALTLSERLGNLPVNLPGPTEKGERRLQKWKGQGPFKKDGSFERRLENANLNESQLLFLLGETPDGLHDRLPQNPAWLEDFLRMITRPSDEIPETADLHLALQPFKPLFTGGIQKLQDTMAELSNRFTELPFDPSKTVELFLPGFKQLFISHLNRTLALEINVARLEGRLEGDTPQARYAGYLTGLQNTGDLLKLMAEYPVLARKLTLLTTNWANVTGEFLTRLAEDWPEIVEKFNHDNPGKLSGVRTGTGDRHRGGRSVFQVEFESGFKIIYKPKSIGSELHFQELLEWLNERGAAPAFRSLKIIDRGSHGWEEFVRAETCKSEDEVRRFYRRQGAFLALLYAMDATDFHQENLIAAREHPVMVDLEALFHPRTSALKTDLTWKGAIEHLENSVMRIGLLPDRIFVGKGQGMDISGLGSKPGQLSPKPGPSWEGSGTDEVRLIREHFEMEGAANLPSLEGQPVSILDFASEISQGFESLYHLLVQNRADFIAGPLEMFRRDELRVILRNTSTYGKLLQESLHPDFLRDGLDRDRFFDHLWVTTEIEPYLTKVIASEQFDLQGGDVPVFTARPDSRDLYDSRGKAIPDFLFETPYQAVRRHIEQLGEADLTWQMWFILAALASVGRSGGIGVGVHDHLRSNSDYPTSNQDEPVPTGDFIAEALKVGERLAELALVRDDKVYWVGLSLINDSAWSIQASGLDLYSGLPGIALFLAFLGEIAGDTRYTRLARQTLNTIRFEVGQLKEVGSGIGTFEGGSGLIYLYSQLGSLWNEPELYREAAELAARLSLLFKKDDVYDIIAGSAGAILALLGLYRVFPSPEILDTAVQAGNHLLEKAVEKPGGLAWPNSQNKEIFLTGFSHGMAGIAFSLLKLAEASGQEKFRKIALAAIGYERTLFSEENQNWADLRESGEPDYMVMWCHGAPGIALGRLAALALLDDTETRQEIESGLATTIKKGFGFNHSLCHGDLGNLEPLLLATQLYPMRYTAPFNYISRGILTSIKNDGAISGMPMQVESPGLMSGLAGIGYGLLRLAAPTRVPSVLVLEGPIRG